MSKKIKLKMSVEECLQKLSVLEEFSRTTEIPPKELIDFVWSLDENIEALKVIKERSLKLRMPIEQKMMDEGKIDKNTGAFLESGYRAEYEELILPIMEKVEEIEFSTFPYEEFKKSEFPTSIKHLRAIKFMLIK